MEIDIMDSLEALGYPKLPSDQDVQELIEEGLSCLEFYEVVEWLANELREICELESIVTSVADIEIDSPSFLLEVSTIIKELYCPYECLTNASMSECLQEKQNRILLLEFMCTELQCAKLLAVKGRKKQSGKAWLDIEMESSPAASCLTSIAKTLEIDLEDKNSDELFASVQSKLEEVITEHPEAVKEPILAEELTESQWIELKHIQEQMKADYSTRKEMLLTRMDVVELSFSWGENAREKEKKLLEIYGPARLDMGGDPEVDIADVLAAREDIVYLGKTSSSEVRKNIDSPLYKHIIADVPDRGGRANEMRPPVEMPSWQKRSDGGRGGGFRGHGGRGNQHRGGSYKRNR